MQLQGQSYAWLQHNCSVDQKTAKPSIFHVCSHRNSYLEVNEISEKLQKFIFTKVWGQTRLNHTPECLWY